MVKYLVKVVEGFDINKLVDLGELTYYTSLDDILFFKTDLLPSELTDIEGVLKVEESRMFKVGI